MEKRYITEDGEVLVVRERRSFVPKLLLIVGILVALVVVIAAAASFFLVMLIPMMIELFAGILLFFGLYSLLYNKWPDATCQDMEGHYRDPNGNQYRTGGTITPFQIAGAGSFLQFSADPV